MMVPLIGIPDHFTKIFMTVMQKNMTAATIVAVKTTRSAPRFVL